MIKTNLLQKVNHDLEFLLNTAQFSINGILENLPLIYLSFWYVVSDTFNFLTHQIRLVTSLSVFVFF